MGVVTLTGGKASRKLDRALVQGTVRYELITVRYETVHRAL